MGAVHDLGSLAISLRHQGRTIGEIAGQVLGPRARLLFLLILFMVLTVVLAIFGLVIAVVFKHYPSAILPCMVQIPIALTIGSVLHRRGMGLFLPSLAALALLYVSVIFGDVGWLAEFNAALQAWPVSLWVVVLLGYSYIASVLPVWLLLQPRDYINSLQLLSALALLLVGLGAAALLGGAPISDDTPRVALELVAPVAHFNVIGAPAMIPFLFITIACGAISGFHCLVASGTSSKQLRCETDAQAVGYGAMLTEGFLAVLVILACVAGLGLGIAGPDGEVLLGEQAWQARYASWNTAQGLGAKVGAFIDGAANLLKALGLPHSFSVALMGVLTASFAATTLDTACRLQRYVVQELAGGLGQPKKTVPRILLVGLRNKHGATLLAIALAVALAAVPPPGSGWSLASFGQGGLVLWPLFGATNQLLGGLAFLVIAFWLWRQRLPIWFLILPAVFMLVVPFWAMVHQLFVQGVGQEQSWMHSSNLALILIALATLALELWMIIEAFVAWRRHRGRSDP